MQCTVYSVHHRVYVCSVRAPSQRITIVVILQYAHLSYELHNPSIKFIYIYIYITFIYILRLYTHKHTYYISYVYTHTHTFIYILRIYTYIHTHTFIYIYNTCFRRIRRFVLNITSRVRHIKTSDLLLCITLRNYSSPVIFVKPDPMTTWSRGYVSGS